MSVRSNRIQHPEYQQVQDLCLAQSAEEFHNGAVKLIATYEEKIGWGSVTESKAARKVDLTGMY